MRRSSRRRGRPVESATLFRKASATGGLPADIHMMSRSVCCECIDKTVM